MSNKITEKNIEIKHQISDDEKILLSDYLVQNEINRALKVMEKKEIIKEFNKEIKLFDEEIATTVQKLSTGYANQVKTVKCEVDSITGDKRYYDLITGELLKTEYNPELEDIETINMFAETKELDEFGMSKEDYKILFRGVYQVPLSISIETDLFQVGINHVVFEGYEGDILAWLKSINITEGFHQLHFEDTTPDMATYKVENLSITNYQVRNYLESQVPNATVENIAQPY
jgi:hypothetical protein